MSEANKTRQHVKNNEGIQRDIERMATKKRREQKRGERRKYKEIFTKK